GQVERAGYAGGFNGDAGGLGKRVAHSQAGIAGRGYGEGTGWSCRARSCRRRGIAGGRLLLGGLLLRLLLLQPLHFRSGNEELPADEHGKRQNDGEKEVAVI